MIKAEVVNVNPELAQKWLNKNITNNRTINEGRVTAYANEMKARNWILNGQAIQFDEGGSLIDGQHRLSAVIRSGMTVQMLVVKNVPRCAVEVIDTMQPRTLPQIQKMNGVTGLRGDKRIIAMYGAHTRDVLGKSGKTTIREFEEWYKQHEEALHVLVNEVCISNGCGTTNGTRASINVALMCAFECGVSASTLAEFVDAYKYTRTGAERNRWPIKLASDAKKYSGNSVHAKALEELTERSIYAFDHYAKTFPKSGRRYTEHDAM